MESGGAADDEVINARFIAVGAIFCLVGCNVVSDEQALREFKAANPEVVVNEQFVGEGNSDSAYMHFRYTTRLGERLEEVWLYVRQQDNSWKAINKSGPKPAGSDFGD